ncbi:MAG TPA: glycosyltransferase [Puia sp.]|jgi:glycosyltransferase involved in cell wall biosynthesis|nr:glycosyltransferase [Puia sp.]
MELNKKKILLFADWYEPGYKAGGPIRSCVNFVNNMQNEFIVYVFTTDRDLASTEPYENIEVDKWISLSESVFIYYCSPKKLNWKNIKQQIFSPNADFIYLNSMFSKYFTVFPLLIIRLSKIKAKIILSPRGMLRDTAIQFKSFKKKTYLNISKWLGLYRNLFFHVVDDMEMADVITHFGNKSKVAVIPNFPAVLADHPTFVKKEIGKLSMVFVGRIHPIKNLGYLLFILKEIPSSVDLSIVGSLEDKSFWESCNKIISELPSNISVKYLGEIPNHQLTPIVSQHHIFILPTKGENFGHAIFEALSQGKPILISNQTPWRNLQQSKVGWDLSLKEPHLFLEAIEQAASFDQQEYNEWSRNAWNYAYDYTSKLHLRSDYIKLFN